MISPVRWIPNIRWMREKTHPSTDQGKKEAITKVTETKNTTTNALIS